MSAHPSASPGRPRSSAARTAVLRAVDDLLAEQGYAAMTMKGIAERAGVGKQTVYRWWSSKAEILVEAVREDAAKDLAVDAMPANEPLLSAFAAAVSRFITGTHAGVAYRALLGEAQHDRAVAHLLADADPLGNAYRALSARAIARGELRPSLDPEAAAADFLGPIVYRALVGQPALSAIESTHHAERFCTGHRVDD